MKNWEEDDVDGHCSAEEDLRDAERVCEQLDIGLRTVNFSTEYWDRVFTPFLSEHRTGRTPNPDVWCNREIKFDVFMDFALSHGSERIATGHYARIERVGAGFRLLKGVDPRKDQSYFLHTLEQSRLSRISFPLGELTKAQVRTLARKAGLATSEKPDSTGICFIGKQPFRQFLRRFLTPRPGPIETTSGRVIGAHPGLAFFTLGQRQGLGLGGRRDGTGEPWYVVTKDLERDALVVAQGKSHPGLYARGLELGHCHWIGEAEPDLPLRCRAKSRYRQPDEPCTVTRSAAGGYAVRFDSPQWAPTPGQSVVLYDREECLGGGTIEGVMER